MRDSRTRSPYNPIPQKQSGSEAIPDVLQHKTCKETKKIEKIKTFDGNGKKDAKPMRLIAYARRAFFSCAENPEKRSNNAEICGKFVKNAREFG